MVSIEELPLPTPPSSNTSNSPKKVKMKLPEYGNGFSHDENSMEEANSLGVAPPKHQWTLPEKKVGSLTITDVNEDGNIIGQTAKTNTAKTFIGSGGNGGNFDAQAAAAAMVLSVDEAERYIEGLSKFALEEVGTSKWIKQHEHLEKLRKSAINEISAKSGKLEKLEIPENMENLKTSKS